MRDTKSMLLTMKLLLGSASARAQLTTVCVNCGNEGMRVAENAVLIDSNAKQSLKQADSAEAASLDIRTAEHE